MSTIVVRSDLTNRLLASFPGESLASLRQEMREVSLAQGAVIFDPGEIIDRVYFPHSGLLSLLVLTSEGHMVEASTIGREGAVGLQCGFGERRSFTRATVQVSGHCSVVPAAAFEQIVARSAPLRDLVSRYIEVLWAEAQQTAACNAVHDASARLCRWLLQSADRLESNLIPLTQEFLAQMLGVRRTTLTLLAQSLQRKGAISYSRGKLIIVDRKLLESCSCECYRVVYQNELPERIAARLYRD